MVYIYEFYDVDEQETLHEVAHNETEAGEVEFDLEGLYQDESRYLITVPHTPWVERPDLDADPIEPYPVELIGWAELLDELGGSITVVDTLVNL